MVPSPFESNHCCFVAVYLAVWWPSLLQQPGHTARSALQANETILNEEVQVDSYINPVPLSSNRIYSPMTNGHAFEIVGGLLSFFLLRQRAQDELN